MSRSSLTVAALVVLAAPAAAQNPKFGQSVQIEFTDKTPVYIPVDVGSGMKLIGFQYPIEQGDQFRVQVEPLKGADMKFHVVIQKPNAGGMWLQYEASSGTQAKVDFTMSKKLAGKQVRILVYSDSEGKANLVISKVGEEPAEDAKDAKIKKLEAEIADLKKQLADVKKLLEAKKP